jgi:deoxyribose-phosphate aldolase
MRTTSADKTATVHPAQTPGRNGGTALDSAWLKQVAVNKSATERRATVLTARSSVKQQWQAAWLLKAISCLDLTTLAGDDTPGKIHRLCAKARRPVPADLLDSMGVADLGITVGAVCVYPAMVPHAVRALEGSGIPVASVAAAFPAGLSPMKSRLEEVRYSVQEGATEIDLVISRRHVLTGDWQALYDEAAIFREACGEAHMKCILGTGELPTLRDMQKASLVAMMAGTDFVKTSTGKEAENATLPVSLTIVRAIRDYRELTGNAVGFKPAGGIRTAKEALASLTLMKEELGRDWLEPELFRIGAFGLLSDIERQLEYYVTARYSAGYLSLV